MPETPAPQHVTWADAQQAFHVGDACQHPALPPLDTLVNPPPDPPVLLLRDPSLRVPVGRPLRPPPTDADGNPLPVPASGLVFDPETGALEWPPEEAEPAPEPAPAPAPAPTTTATASTSTRSTSSTPSASTTA